MIYIIIMLAFPQILHYKDVFLSYFWQPFLILVVPVSKFLELQTLLVRRLIEIFVGVLQLIILHVLLQFPY